MLLIGGEEIEDGSDVVGEGEAGERSLTLRLKKPASWLLTLVDATAQAKVHVGNPGIPTNSWNF